jgi:hypothetical protein
LIKPNSTWSVLIPLRLFRVLIVPSVVFQASQILALLSAALSGFIVIVKLIDFLDVKCCGGKPLHELPHAHEMTNLGPKVV